MSLCRSRYSCSHGYYRSAAAHFRRRDVLRCLCDRICPISTEGFATLIMKRFNDVLRLLSSILLGGVVRELDDFQHALLRLINVDGPHPLSSIVAHTTAI